MSVYDIESEEGCNAFVNSKKWAFVLRHDLFCT